MQQNIPIRLGKDTYQREGPSYTDKLKRDDISMKLANYEEVKKNINTIPLNTHVRYFIYDPRLKQNRFRLGGFIRRNNDPRYVVLATEPIGGKTWSVQTAVNGKKTVFFVLKDKTEIEVESRTAELEKLYRDTRKQLQECKQEQGVKVSKKVLRNNPHGKAMKYKVQK